MAQPQLGRPRATRLRAADRQCGQASAWKPAITQPGDGRQRRAARFQLLERQHRQRRASARRRPAASRQPDRRQRVADRQPVGVGGEEQEAERRSPPASADRIGRQPPPLVAVGDPQQHRRRRRRARDRSSSPARSPATGRWRCRASRRRARAWDRPSRRPPARGTRAASHDGRSAAARTCRWSSRRKNRAMTGSG